MALVSMRCVVHGVTENGCLRRQRRQPRLWSASGTKRRRALRRPGRRRGCAPRVGCRCSAWCRWTYTIGDAAAQTAWSSLGGAYLPMQLLRGWAALLDANHNEHANHIFSLYVTHHHYGLRLNRLNTLCIHCAAADFTRSTALRKGPNAARNLTATI
jgi:hypothetical protein